MLDFTLKHLRCLHCNSGLLLDSIFGDEETVEGFLNCTGCKSCYPIISKVPFMLEDLSSYFAIRMSLGGHLMLLARSGRMKSHVKDSLKRVRHVLDDTTNLEKRWVEIYKQSARSKFYSQIRRTLVKLPKCDAVLEHGCSIGNVARAASKRHGMVFGIDKSFYGILEAKRERRKNMDFVVADSIRPPFGNKKFSLVLALNLLDIVEPRKLLDVVFRQAKDFVVLSDPYDFERGKKSVKQRITPEDSERNCKIFRIQIDSWDKQANIHSVETKHKSKTAPQLQG